MTGHLRDGTCFANAAASQRAIELVRPGMVKDRLLRQVSRDGRSEGMLGAVDTKNIQHTVRYTELSPDRFKASGMSEGHGVRYNNITSYRDHGSLRGPRDAP